MGKRFTHLVKNTIYGCDIYSFLALHFFYLQLSLSLLSASSIKALSASSAFSSFRSHVICSLLTSILYLISLLRINHNFEWPNTIILLLTIPRLSPSTPAVAHNKQTTISPVQHRSACSMDLSQTKQSLPAMRAPACSKRCAIITLTIILPAVFCTIFVTVLYCMITRYSERRRQSAERAEREAKKIEESIHDILSRMSESEC